MEPSAQDVAAVSQAISEPTGQPAQAPTYTPGVQQAPAAPVAQPEPQQQPAAPVSQPAPIAQPQDPFSTMFQQPQSTDVTPNPQPQQPVEPAQPTQTTGEQVPPTAPPVAPVAPPVAPPVATPPAEKVETFEEYMDKITQGVGEAPVMPDSTKIDPTDEAGIKNFFDDLVNTAVQKAEQSIRTTNAIQNTERQLWDGAFEKYGTLRSNKQLRDMVHSIRMGEFNKGVAITPTQAADRLLDALKAERQRGIAENQVQTTIQDVQPTGGGGQQIETTLDNDNVLKSVQDGGETALAAYLDTQVKAGKI